MRSKMCEYAIVCGYKAKKYDSTHCLGIWSDKGGQVRNGQWRKI